MKQHWAFEYEKKGKQVHVTVTCGANRAGQLIFRPEEWQTFQWVFARGVDFFPGEITGMTTEFRARA